MVRRLMIAATLLGASACASGQSVVFVRANASSGGTGASWASAYVDLQSALTFAAAHPGTQIWVAEGTYYPGQGSTARSSTFQVPSGTILIGGFAGWERTLDERNPAQHRTRLSGDVRRDDHLQATNHQNNATSVVTVLDAAYTTVLKDLTITAGYGPDGAGVRIVMSHVELADCDISGNRGEYTGQNRSRGGTGVSIGSTAAVTMKRCRFIGNWAAPGSTGLGTADYGGHGGAILCDSSALLVDSCFFAENLAGDGGSITCGAGHPFVGVPGGNGGAMCLMNDASATVTNCVFEANRAGLGAEMYCCGYGCASTIGGIGAAVHIGRACVAVVSHCTFAGNVMQSDAADAVITGFNASCSIDGSIIWDDATQLSRHIKPWIAGTVRHSCIRGLSPSTDQFGNTGSDPLLAGGPMRGLPATGMSDVELLPGSPCIDAASSVLASFLDVDGVGMPRVMDNLDAANLGVGTAGIPDIGALESTTAVIDANANAISDSAEIERGDAQDCDGDGVPDGVALHTTTPLRLPAGMVTAGLGSAVSVDGDWMFAGSPGDHAGAGSVVTFRRVTSGWLPLGALARSDAGDAFGASVAVSGSWAMVGAPNATRQGQPAASGTVWIYRLVDGTWQEWQVLTAPDARTAQRFGAGVALANDRGVIGAPGDDERGAAAGAVYVLDYDEATAAWSATRKFTVAAFGAGAGLGSAVAAAPTPFGAIVAAGAPGHDGRRGGGLVLRRRSATWVVEATRMGQGAGDRFGASVAADSQRVCFGAPGFGQGNGAAFLMSMNGSTWGLASIIGGGTNGQNAGIAVSLAGSRVLVGDVSGVTLHVESSGAWWRVHSRTGPPGFGAAIATDGDWGVVGADSGSGAVFAFPWSVSDCNAGGIPDSCELAMNPTLDQDANGIIDDCQPCPVCIADFDRNGGIDGSDLEPFIAAWSDSSACADVNRDGGIDGADLETFIRRWEAGSCD